MDNSPSGPAELRVVVYSKPVSPDLLAAVLQHELRLHHTDALIWARHLPGVLNGTFSEEKAQALVAALARIGVRSRAILADEVPDLRRTTVIHHVRCTDLGLQVIQIDGEPGVLVPWDAIQMVCIGEVPIDVNRHYSAAKWTGISAGHHFQSAGINLTGAPTCEAWIVSRPPLPVICIDQGYMNYEYLGSRRVDSAASNFHTFIADVTRQATSAKLTESTVAYLSHIKPEMYRFVNREELIRHVTLQALIVRETNSTVQPQPPTEALSLGTP